MSVGNALKLYDKYKDSGIEWIGEIPESKEIIRNKYYLFYLKGKNPEEINSENIGLPYIGASELDNISGCVNYANYTTEIDLPACQNEDVLILWDGARAGLIGTNHAGIISSTIVNLLPNQDVINKKFLFYYLKGFERFLFDRVNGTTIPHMNKKFIEEICFVKFKTDEQQQIADYLDKKCGEVDRVVEVQKQIIEKLKEYKQSVITEAVTKGLDKNTPLKDSGIEWIGKIPQHWKIFKIKHCVIFNPTYCENLDDNLPVSFAPMECLTNCHLICKESTIEKVSKGYTYFAEEDIIMAKVTPCFENGNIAIAKNLINNVGFGTSELYVFRAININNRFLLYFLQNSKFKDMAISTMYGTGGLKRVSGDFVKNYKFGLPSNTEQKQIAEYLDKKCSEIDKAISEKEALIEKLTQYKKSLIYECVTGKRRVVA